MDNEKKKRLVELRDNLKSYGYMDVVEELENIFPDLKESDDEKIRKEIINYILYKADGVSEEQEHSWIAYLEKQKEQKPAEWSEEDEIYLQDALWCVKQASKVARGENDMGACWSAERWLKSLRPQPHTVSIKDATKFGNLEYERGVKDGIQSEKSRQWKPSEEQMDALEHFIRSWGESGTMSPQNPILCAAESLYTDLQKL